MSLRFALTLILLLVMASCGRDGESGPPIPSAGTLTLGDDSCSYEGPGEIASGALSVSIVNGTNDAATFEVWKINEGSTFEDFQTHISTQQPAVEQGAPTIEPPPFAEVISSASVGRGENGAFAATVDPGTYGFACSRLDTSDDLVAILAAGPLEVTSVQAGFALILLGVVGAFGILAATLVWRRKRSVKTRRQKVRVPEAPVPPRPSGERKYGF